MLDHAYMQVLGIAGAGIKCGEVLKRVLLKRGVEGVGKVNGCYGEKRG